MPTASLRRVCRALDVNRSTVYLPKHGPAASSAAPELDEQIAGLLHELVQQHPTFGYRRLWALLRFGQKIPVNLKKMHRIVQLRRWQVKERLAAPRPRVQQKVSRAEASNERWAMDVTHIYCGWSAPILCSSKGLGLGLVFRLVGSPSGRELRWRDITQTGV